MYTRTTSTMTRQQQLTARAAMHDAAKASAARLRREAIDAFWSRIGRGIADASRSLLAGLRDSMRAARRHIASRLMTGKATAL